jgi:phosphate acetyltransferase
MLGIKHIKKDEQSSLYHPTSEHNSGKSIITLGLMSILIEPKQPKWVILDPLSRDFDDSKLDNHIETVISHFGF